MFWPTASNAALGCDKSPTDSLAVSLLTRTLNSLQAGSVLWLGPKPDWNSIKKKSSSHPPTDPKASSSLPVFLFSACLHLAVAGCVLIHLMKVLVKMKVTIIPTLTQPSAVHHRPNMNIPVRAVGSVLVRMPKR